jgi:hypothetical protein
VGVPDVEKRFVGYGSHCRIEVDRVGIGNSVGQFLYGWMCTLTNVVLPVPDIPMAMMQQFLLFYMQLL